MIYMIKFTVTSRRLIYPYVLLKQYYVSLFYCTSEHAVSGIKIIKEQVLRTDS